MKPVYLEMTYFGPHEHSIIDFRKLEESAIFLIGGDTGAGKSTIFDAMTFALFASTTNSDRDAKELRSQFAPNDKATKVIFYFEQNGKIYKVERTPEQLLQKKRGTGLKISKSTANLSIVDDINGVELESIATLPRDVGSEIDNILKLKVDQFKKIILLPQNDFSEFLKSSTNDKEAILKKIFGTQIFTDFTSRLKACFDKANETNATYTQELNSQFNSTIWTEQEQLELKAATDEQRLSVLEKIVKERHNILLSTQTEENRINDSWKIANTNYLNAQNIQKLFDDLTTNKRKYQTQIVSKSDMIIQKKEHVTELEWAKPLSEVIRDLEKAKTERLKISQNKADISKSLQTVKTKFNQAKTNLDKLNAQKDLFDQKDKESQELVILINNVQHSEELTQNLLNLKPKLHNAEISVQEKINEISALQQQIDEKSKNIVSVEILQNNKNKLISERDEYLDRLTPLVNNQIALNKDLSRIQNNLNTLNDEFKIKSNQLNTAQVDYEAKKRNRQSLMIAQLRKELVDDRPCPVCGSIEHPYAATIVDADEEQLRKSIEGVDQSQKDFAAANNSVQIVSDNIDQTTKELREKQQELSEADQRLIETYQTVLNDSSIELPKNFSLKDVKESFKTATENLDEEIAQAQKIIQTIKELEEQLTDSKTKLNQNKLELSNIKSKRETWSADLAKYQAEIPDLKVTSLELQTTKEELESAVESYQKELKLAENLLHANEIDLKQIQTQLEDIEKQLSQHNEIIASLTAQTNDALNSSTAKTSNFDILKQWITELEHDKLSDFKDDIASYNKEKELLSTAIEQLETNLTGKEKPNLMVLKETLDELQNQRTAAIKASTSATNAFDDAEKIQQRVLSIVKKQGSFKEEFNAIASLYNVINGKGNVNSKLKLETFVVQNYLQQVLKYANEHFLNLLSGGRYTFVLASDASDMRTDHGLDINVFDGDTGFVRSSKTLSGGETFIAALSIALSLSEVVQSSSNGVKIDALFIDEGFGSLDNETLDKAMEALERIGQNRMVGVISHVESMKNTIGQQLLIKKLGNGHSRVELINK